MLLSRVLASVPVVLSLLGFGPSAQAQGSAVTIDSSVTLVEAAQESGPVRRATDDLLSDFSKVFGQAPRRVDRLEDAGPVAILIAERSRVPAGLQCATATEAEAFAFSMPTT